MLELRDVSRVFTMDEFRVQALTGANLRVGPGDFAAITGPSGSGKSTLLQIAGCLDRPTTGDVRLDGVDLTALSDAERARLRLTTFGFVFQRFHLVSVLSAVENVAVPMEALGIDAAERYERAWQLLDHVGLAERVEFMPSRLSGGERQRVAIARAVANRPRYLLADEPTGALHSEDRDRIVALFRRLNESGIAIIMVTHDPQMALLATNRFEIRDGVLRPAT